MGPGRVVGSLRLFRRVFQEVGAEKGWDKPDILMEERNVTVAPRPVFETYLPVVTTTE